MDYMILDTAGNALASFDDEVAAHATIHAMVAVEPEAAEHVVLLAYSDDGMPVGEALSVWDVPLPVTVEASQFLQPHATQVLMGVSHRSDTRYFGNPTTWGVQIQDPAVPA